MHEDHMKLRSTVVIQKKLGMRSQAASRNYKVIFILMLAASAINHADSSTWQFSYLWVFFIWSVTEEETQTILTGKLS
jgi:hypothetical protein